MSYSFFVHVVCPRLVTVICIQPCRALYCLFGLVIFAESNWQKKVTKYNIKLYISVYVDVNWQVHVGTDPYLIVTSRRWLIIRIESNRGDLSWLVLGHRPTRSCFQLRKHYSLQDSPYTPYNYCISQKSRLWRVLYEPKPHIYIMFLYAFPSVFHSFYLFHQIQPRIESWTKKA